MRKLYHITLLVLLSVVSAAQTATVTLQVTDLGGQSWNNGTWTVKLTPGPGQQPPVQYVLAGTSTVVPNQQQNGNLSGSGGASITLTENSVIAPAMTQWTFNVCPLATPASCYQYAATITASGTLTLTPPAIQISMVSPPSTVIAYADNELFGMTYGNSYYNLILPGPKYWNGTSWTAYGSGGGGGISGSGTANYVTKFTGPTAVGNSSIQDGGGGTLLFNDTVIDFLGTSLVMNTQGSDGATYPGANFELQAGGGNGTFAPGNILFYAGAGGASTSGGNVEVFPGAKGASGNYDGTFIVQPQYHGTVGELNMGQSAYGAFIQGYYSVLSSLAGQIYFGSGTPSFSCTSAGPSLFLNTSASSFATLLYGCATGSTWTAYGSGGSGGDSITSPNSTLSVGGTSSATTLDINLGHANTWTAGQTVQVTGPAGTCYGQQYPVASAVTQYQTVSLGTSGISPSGTSGGPVRGVAQATASSGNVTVCFFGPSSVLMDGTATAGDVAVTSTSTGGEAYDSGQTSSNNIPITSGDLGLISTGCSGAGCTATVQLKGADFFGREVTSTVAVFGPVFTPEANGGIQGAINALVSAGGGTVALCTQGPTNYTISSTLNFDLGGWFLASGNMIGSGMGSCSITITSASAKTLSIVGTSGSAPLFNPTFQGFSLFRASGGSVVNPTGTATGVYYKNCSWCTFIDVASYDSAYGFWEDSGSANNLRWRTNAGAYKATSGVLAGYYHTLVDADTDYYAAVCGGSSAVGCLAGIGGGMTVPCGWQWATTTVDFFSAESELTGTTTGACFNGLVSDTKWIHPVFEAPTTGFAVNEGLSADCPTCYLSIVDPYIHAVQQGVVVTNGQNVQIEGGECSAQQNCVVFTGPYSTKNIAQNIMGSTLAPLSNLNTNLFASIAGASHNVISSNTCDSLNSSTPYNSCVYVEDSSYNTIVGNLGINYGLSGIYIDSASSNNSADANTMDSANITVPFSVQGSNNGAGASINLAAAATPASDNFTRANGGLGSNYTLTNGTACTIVSNTAQEATASVQCVEVWNALSPANNQWSQITIGTMGTNNEAFAGVRMSSSAYTAYLFGSSQSGQCYLYKVVSGTPTAISSASCSTPSGTVLRLEANGTLIQGYINGLLAVTRTDSAISSGGVGFQIASGSTVSNSITAFSGNSMFIAATPVLNPTPAPTAGQLYIGQSNGSYQPETASGSCTVTAAGVFSCSGSGSGTVNTGTQYAMTMYPNSGSNTVVGPSTITTDSSGDLNAPANVNVSGQFNMTATSVPNQLTATINTQTCSAPATGKSQMCVEPSGATNPGDFQFYVNDGTAFDLQATLNGKQATITGAANKVYGGATPSMVTVTSSYVDTSICSNAACSQNTTGSAASLSSNLAASKLPTTPTTEGADGFWMNGTPAGDWMGTISTGVPANNTVYVYQFVPTRNYVVGHETQDVTTAGTGVTGFACIYNSTSSAAVWSASNSFSTSTGAGTGSATQYTLLAGTTYYIGVGQSSTSTGTFSTWPATSASVVAMINAQAAGGAGNPAWYSTAANAYSSGCPSTLGTLTAVSGTTVLAPVTLLGP